MVDKKKKNLPKIPKMTPEQRTERHRREAEIFRDLRLSRS